MSNNRCAGNSKKSNSELSGQDGRYEKKRTAFAVVGGDVVCMREVARLWGNEHAHRTLHSNRALHWVISKDGNQYIAFIGDTTSELAYWPGGPLLWLFPDRGPGAPELAILRCFLAMNAQAREDLRVMILLSDDVEERDVPIILDDVVQTLEWGIGHGIDFVVSAVCLAKETRDEVFGITGRKQKK